VGISLRLLPRWCDERQLLQTLPDGVRFAWSQIDSHLCAARVSTCGMAAGVAVRSRRGKVSSASATRSTPMCLNAWPSWTAAKRLMNEISLKDGFLPRGDMVGGFTRAATWWSAAGNDQGIRATHKFGADSECGCDSGTSRAGGIGSAMIYAADWPVFQQVGACRECISK